MKRKIILLSFTILLILLVGTISFLKFNPNTLENKTIECKVISIENTKITIENKDHNKYTFNINKNEEFNIGDELILTYSNITTKNELEVINYKKVIQEVEVVEETNKRLFESFYQQASNKLTTMTLDEKIKQLLLVRYKNGISADVGGYIFFEKDFRNKNINEVQDMINNLQNNSKIPLLTAVDEEGGVVVRISSNPNLINEKFKSSKELYDTGGFNLITNDVKTKSSLLKKLGINLNLAPVVDITDNENAYMYNRSIGYGKEITSEYAKTVIEASKNTDVSYTLKHFPGYGNNEDTHINLAIDNRSYDDIINNDIIPFKEGIKAGAEAVLVSHNIITSIDNENPASLSKSVIDILKNNLNFSGVIITDDLDMGATKNIESKYVKALQAGNDLLIVTDEISAYNEIKEGINKEIITEEIINEKVTQILAWKYYKLLINDINK